MLFSHRFGSVETLSRAHFWLTHHGFEVVKVDGPSHDVARLTLNVNFSKAAAAQALIDSIERSDPAGWPSNTTPTAFLRSQDSSGLRSSSDRPSVQTGSPVHWHPGEPTHPVDDVSLKVREYMLSRWE